MDPENLGQPNFKPVPEPRDEVNNNNNNINKDDNAINKLSFATIAKVKVIANRAVARRRSLFDVDDRVVIDEGQSTLSHADFPALPLKSRAASVDAGVKEFGFDKELIYGILEHEMTNKLQGKYYDPTQCDIHVKQITSAVKERIAALNMKNFKTICVCYISKRSSCHMKMESGCAWDELITAVDDDGFVDYVFQNEFISAVGTVYAVCCTRKPQKSPTRSSSFPSRSRRLSLIETRR